jgi:hypothetical protein
MSDVNVEWNDGYGISLIWHGELATFDFDRLTRLVFLRHDARIRVSISSGGPLSIRLILHPRVETGGLGLRHPNLDEAVAEFRAYLPANHPIVFRGYVGDASKGLASLG